MKLDVQINLGSRYLSKSDNDLFQKQLEDQFSPLIFAAVGAAFGVAVGKVWEAAFIAIMGMAAACGIIIGTIIIWPGAVLPAPVIMKGFDMPMKPKKDILKNI